MDGVNRCWTRVGVDVGGTLLTARSITLYRKIFTKVSSQDDLDKIAGTTRKGLSGHGCSVDKLRRLVRDVQFTYRHILKMGSKFPHNPPATR